MWWTVVTEDTTNNVSDTEKLDVHEIREGERKSYFLIAVKKKNPIIMNGLN